MANSPQAWLEGLLLHRRDYRETSLLTDFFTREHGKISAVVRGVRGSKNDKKSLLQPFQVLHLTLSGKHELRNLNKVEATQNRMLLQGEAMYCGMYLNELLNRALPVNEPHPTLFKGYLLALKQLAANVAAEPVLREFELLLLSELGYALVLDIECDTGEPVNPDGYYQVMPELGVQSALPGSLDVYSGENLINIAAGRWNPTSLQAAKRICRQSLRPIIGDKPLKSRELFVSPNKQK